MRLNQAGLEFIKNFEGLRLKPYNDGGNKITIGFGHTQGVTANTPEITEEQAEEYLKQDVDWAEKTVNFHVTAPINQNQFNALVSFAFNIGPNNFKKSTLLKKLNNQDYDGAANEFLRWDKDGVLVIDGLTRRRKAERVLFKTKEVENDT